MKNNKILFVGSFKSKAKDGSLGGQMFASRTIIESELSNQVQWTLIDTTSDSNILAPFYKRLLKASRRIFKFSFYLLFKRFDSMLIFTGDGYSVWEKGLMIVLAKKLTNSKVIFAPRSGIIINDVNANGRLSKFIRFILSKADIVMCQSAYWKTYFWSLNQENDLNKFKVVENWIDIAPYERLPIRSNDGIPVILFLSWVDKNKGIYELLEAVKRLKEEKCEFRLLIGGQGEAFDKVTSFIADEKLDAEISLLGWVYKDRKLELLSEADIYVLPSYFEGYPNSLVEAMASAKACIATKVGAIPDIISHESNGLLIERADANDLYQKLKLLIEDKELRGKLSIKAREKIKKTNTIEAGITHLKNILLKH